MTEDNLDDVLGRLARAPLPQALSRIDDGVLARVEQVRLQGQPIGARITIACAGAAMVLGIFGSAVSTAMPDDISSLSPSSVAQPLAPSTLLASIR